jgi:hypothetical protein
MKMSPSSISGENIGKFLIDAPRIPGPFRVFKCGVGALVNDALSKTMPPHRCSIYIGMLRAPCALIIFRPKSAFTNEMFKFENT